MSDNNYEVQDNQIKTLLSWIESGEIGLPEMQRPFVWKSSKVRDLIDSLYNGFPIGYIITWNNPSLRLKDGSMSLNKKVMIDGQQRITALRAAIEGEPVIDQKFQKKRIRIAFNPKTEEFATLNGAIRKDSRWIPDIAELFAPGFSRYSFIPKFAEQNGYDADEIARPIEKLFDLVNNQIGNISLSSNLDIDAVTEIFNRINSKGIELSTADFIMSKLSADTDHEGNNIRKCIEYFSMFLADPSSLDNIVSNDEEFAKTEYFEKIKWVAREKSDLYLPRFGDIFHVILGFEFGRGKHADLVSLVSGRDFETRTYTESAMKNSYEHLKHGILSFVNESNFNRYIMILKSLGMQSRETLALNGMGIINFGYSLYLYLKTRSELTESQLESVVKRWIIMSAITSRYSGSSETRSEADIKLFMSSDNTIAVADQETVRQLSNDFWNVLLPQKFVSSSTAANVWRVFLMAQVHDGDSAWLEKDHRVESLISEQGNIHHIFPRAYLKQHGFSQTQFNQIANYTWLTQPRNLQISNQAPKDYLNNPEVTEFASEQSFEVNAIPKELVNYDYSNYNDFLSQRRVLMASKVKRYYQQL